jgi:hypothetical protein
MRFVSGKRFVLAAISLAFILAAYGGSSHTPTGAAAVAKVKTTVLPHGFAGFFPRLGARATLPGHGTTLLEFPRGNLYADGHIITDRGVRLLTPWGARLLWSKIRTIGLAAGLFGHNVETAVVSQHHINRWYFVCSGRHMISAHVGTSASPYPLHPLSPARARALARVDALFANATSRLPARAWADRTVRPYVPRHYDLSHDRYDPDPAKLPSPAREQLAQYKASHWEQGITTDQARALIAAFIKSGVKPLPRTSRGELDFSLPIAHVGAWGTDSTVLRVFQDGPPNGDTHNYCRYPVP